MGRPIVQNSPSCLKFSPANSKLSLLALAGGMVAWLGGVLTPRKRDAKRVYSLDLLAGVTCPGARNCRGVCKNSKVVDGPYCEFRCYAASGEARLRGTYNVHFYNTSLLKKCRTVDEFVQLIEKSIPSNAGVIRPHSSGDWFSYNYLLAMYIVATRHPNILFYCYTKSLHFVKKLVESLPSQEGVDLPNGQLAPNFYVTGSRGGKYDHLIEGLGIRVATVYQTAADAPPNEVVCLDEVPATTRGGNFALVLHGVQPKGKFQPNIAKIMATKLAKQNA